jgi:hypothetical protein
LSPTAGDAWGFNDYPLGTVTDPTPYDGSIGNTYGLCFGTLVSTAGCSPGCGNSGYISSFPYLTTVPFAATWFQIGTVDTPGDDPYDTHLVCFSATANFSTPYILATYFVMDSGALVLDTYGGTNTPGTTTGCVDGALSGVHWIPQPSGKNFPTGLFTVSGPTLHGPIGRIVAVIEGTTCGTWSGTTPT